MRLSTCALIAGAVFFGSPASGEQVRFRGSFTITSIQNCLARYVGETFNSAFRPASVGDNPNVTSLTQLNQYSGDVYELKNATFGLNRWINLSGYGFDNLHYTFAARIFLSRLPAITPSTNFLTLEGEIWNMGNDPGVAGKKCVAGFRGAYFRRIE